MSRVLFDDRRTSLVWKDMPAPGKETVYAPFVRSNSVDKSRTGMAWEARMFVPSKASRSSGYASLGTAMVALGRVNDERHDQLVEYNIDAFAQKIEEIGGLENPALRLLINSLRHASCEVHYKHGVKIKHGWHIQAPKPAVGERHHFLVMEPFGKVLHAMTSGALGNTALEMGGPNFMNDARSDETVFFQVAVYGIRCEDPTDALTIAYSLEAEEIEFELY